MQEMQNHKVYFRILFTEEFSILHLLMYTYWHVLPSLLRLSITAWPLQEGSCVVNEARSIEHLWALCVAKNNMIHIM